MEKLTIKNRKGENMVVILEKAENPKGLAFVMHGLGGIKEAPQIEMFAHCFLEKGYTTVRFDTTNSFGESDGKYEDATATNYYEDLEDVIEWAKTQSWYQEPFCLAGHSLGSMCIALYAENFPDKVKALAPISTVVSGKLSIKSKPKEEVEDWKNSGWKIQPHHSFPGVMKKLKWSHMEDRLKYDLLPKVGNLTMPVLMIVGDQDISTIPKDQKILFEKLPRQKELHIIKGAPHTFREQKYLDEIKQIFLNWIEKI